MSWPQIKKIINLKCHLFFILHSSKQFLHLIMTCNKKWILYDNQQWAAHWFDQDNAPKHFTKPNWDKKRSGSLLGGLLSIWSTKTLWTLVKPLQWDAPKAAVPAAGSGQQKGPCSPPWQHLTAHWTTSASKVERIRLQSFASSMIFTWPFTDQLPLIQAPWQHFTGKMLPQPTGCRKCIARIHWIPKHRFLCTGISKLICCWQKCVDCNGFYFDD